jgi:hypothetical protein
VVQLFSFRSRISPTSAGLALPLESFITWLLSEFSAAQTLPTQRIFPHPHPLAFETHQI